MEQQRPSLDIALAYFVKSLTNLIWIFGLAIIADVYLVSQGFSSSPAVFTAIQKIVAGVFWVIALIKILEFIERNLDKARESPILDDGEKAKVSVE